VTACRLNIQLSETAMNVCGCYYRHTSLGAVATNLLPYHCRLLPKVHAGLGKRAKLFLKTGCRLLGEHRVTIRCKEICDEATEDDGTMGIGLQFVI